MSFYLVDLMPLLWAAAMVLSLLLAAEGERILLLTGVLPALLGFAAYCAGLPARRQVLLGLIAFALLLGQRVLYRLLRRRASRRTRVAGEGGV